MGKISFSSMKNYFMESPLCSSTDKRSSSFFNPFPPSFLYDNPITKQQLTIRASGPGLKYGYVDNNYFFSYMYYIIVSNLRSF